MAEAKFNRNYFLQVERQDGRLLEIEPPFTLEFDVTRNTLSSVNIASIRIYNLSQYNRNQIEFNIYNQGAFRKVRLQAGYGTMLPIIFDGNITHAWSVREGTNFITQVECFDAGYAYNNAFTSVPFPANTPNKTVIESLIDSLKPYQVTKGTIGSYPGNTGRGKSYSGPTCALLAQLSNKGFFIDNGVANCLGNDECLLGNFPLINSATGLLGTPVREEQILTFDMIFEPRLVVGQIIELDSRTVATNAQSQVVNGKYKVTSIKHKGMISETICGEAITTLGMFLGQNGPDGLRIPT